MNDRHDVVGALKYLENGILNCTPCQGHFELV